jgi:hypothetical protein
MCNDYLSIANFWAEEIGMDGGLSVIRVRIV